MMVETPRAPLLHALVLVILVIGVSDAKRLSAPTSSNETASNETALTQPATNEMASEQPASNETALKQPASNETSLNQTRQDAGWHYIPETGEHTMAYKDHKDTNICKKEKDPCHTNCKCWHLLDDQGNDHGWSCKWNRTSCNRNGAPCYDGRKEAGDCCESCPNGPNCLIWRKLLQPGDIHQNPRNKSEYAMCGKTGFRIYQITEWDEKSGLPYRSTFKPMSGGTYPVDEDTQ